MATKTKSAISQENGIEALRGTKAWHDVKDYFTDLFGEHPEWLHYIATPDQLACDLQIALGKKYNANAIVALLRNGFEQANGNFLFKRNDFEGHPAREIEGVRG